MAAGELRRRLPDGVGRFDPRMVVEYSPSGAILWQQNWGTRAGDTLLKMVMDDADLLAVLFAFGQSGSGLSEDVNGDGVVDDADLLTVLFNFGNGC